MLYSSNSRNSWNCARFVHRWIHCFACRLVLTMEVINAVLAAGAGGLSQALDTRDDWREARGPSRLSILHVAVARNLTWAIGPIRDRAPALVHEGDLGDWKPLHEAARQRNANAAAILMAAGADPNAQDQDRWTPFLEAAEKESVEVMQVLFDGGALIDYDQQYSSR